MKRLLTMLVLLVAGWSQAMAQGAAGAIIGTVTDENNDPVINAQVQVSSGGVIKGGSVTDFDGNYIIKPLMPGRYEVKVNYLGYKENLTTGVLVQPGQNTKVNVKLKRSDAAMLEEVVITEYKVPLIDKYQGGSTSVKTSEEIETMATRNTTTMAGARTNGTLYIVDGVQVYGSRGINVSQNAIERSNRKSRRATKHMTYNSQYLNPSVESYKKNPENDFKTVAANPLSTMSVDVDRASYSNIRRFIESGQLPPADAVRIEEMVNYFHYNYPQPKDEHPLAIVTELTDCPWQPGHQLPHIGMQAKTIATESLPASNLVFLVDVSGSMGEPNKLPLVKESLKLLTKNLRDKDHIAIVVYAGSAGLVLPPTPGNHKQTIYDALDRLQSGGSTAGGAGIQLAYKTASEHYIRGGNNRVILATDGDFNVGISGDNELETLITKEREKGIYLTCLGYGMGNYKDSKLEVLADKGNGNYAYIDDIKEAEKTLGKEFGGTIFTLAKDVKAQIEFNPSKVQAYRLVGYENRILNEEDFKDDKKDAGDMGSGHSVTIIYEIIPTGIKSDKVRKVTPLKYQKNIAGVPVRENPELATIKFRYKKPNGNTSMEMAHVIGTTSKNIELANDNVKFASSVAMFGMLLKKSEYKGNSSYDKALALAKSAREDDAEGYRTEYIQLLKKSATLAGKHNKVEEEDDEIVGWFAEED
ncbi:MAG TPA: von Willebrand factor type A domain-containing protein [Flavipsychrobacter sp.]